MLEQANNAFAIWFEQPQHYDVFVLWWRISSTSRALTPSDGVPTALSPSWPPPADASSTTPSGDLPGRGLVGRPLVAYGIRSCGVDESPLLPPGVAEPSWRVLKIGAAGAYSVSAIDSKFRAGHNLDIIRRMLMTQIKSTETDAMREPRVAYAAAETVRKAQAVGLVRDMPEDTELTLRSVKRVVVRIRQAGLGARAARGLERAAPDDVDTILRELRELDALLEESPLPATEWRRLLDVLGRDQLVRLVGVSPSSVARYAKGERDTPDAVAARVHFLALVVGDLAGAYNDLGIRRWFERTRTVLEGRAPATLLGGKWQPEELGALQVRDLARALVSSAAT